MKKTFLFIVIMACTQLHTHAQFLIGPQAGISFAKLTGTDFTVDSKPGWHVGSFISIPLAGGHLTLMPALLYELDKYEYNYTTTTVKNTDTTYTETADINATLGYLNIPVVLNYFFGEKKGFMIQAGLQYSLLVTDNSTVSTTITMSTTGGDPQTSEPTNENKITFSKSDVSIVGGVGYKFPKLLMLYARAKTGLLEAQNGAFIKDENSGHNFVFEGGIALCFGAQ